MRATRDLMCGSSACPDDIDPTNAWNPTDIHVRVYPAKNIFKKAIAFRMKPDSDPVLTKETGFHSRTSQHTRNYTEYRGYWLPTCFTGSGAIEEYLACRERAAIMDLSPLRKFEVLGPDAETLVNYTVTRNIRRLAVGQVVYTAMCYPTGGMMDDGTVFRLGSDNFRVICGDEYFGTWMREQADSRGWRVWVRSSTDQIANVAVQGPLSREILGEVVWTPPTQASITELGWFKFTIGRLGDSTGIPVMVSRTGYTGELGFEVFCHPTDAPAVWDAIWAQGEPRGMKPLGLSALDMLRIEAGLIFSGYEFNDQIDPFEAGISFAVPLKTKADDFVGKQALLQRSAHPQRVLVGLDITGTESVGHGDGVYDGRAQVGVITSATRSPLLSRTIALCRIDVAYAALETAVEVGKLDGQQKRIPAKVARFPFYDPEKTRVRC
jgi:aminomethyltransferase